MINGLDVAPVPSNAVAVNNTPIANDFQSSILSFIFAYIVYSLFSGFVTINNFISVINKFLFDLFHPFLHFLSMFLL